MTEAAKPLKVAILAMGGQGGGVLANWLIEAAERSGCLAQSTAVPGVAQRTGATLYYLEIVPGGKNAEPAPVLALMPVPGHVDVVVAGELAEAGRALQRGLITPQRTAAIVSTHRDYAIDEKSAPADGRVDSERLAAIVQRKCQAIRRLRHGGPGRGNGQRHQFSAARRHCRAPAHCPSAGRSARR